MSKHRRPPARPRLTVIPQTHALCHSPATRASIERSLAEHRDPFKRLGRQLTDALDLDSVAEELRARLANLQNPDDADA